MATPYELALADEGTWEWAEGHNPKVVQYFADVGHGWVKDDETAWCAAFVGSCITRAGIELPPLDKRLAARSYLDWGKQVALTDARKGDVAIFSRGNSSWQGHVGFVDQMTPHGIRVLGGNQRNQVNISTYSTKRLLGVRRWVGPVTEPAPPSDGAREALARIVSIAREALK